MEFQLHKAVEELGSRPSEKPKHEPIFEVHETPEFQLIYVKSRLPGGALMMRVDAGRFTPEEYEDLTNELRLHALYLSYGLRVNCELSESETATAGKIAIDRLRSELVTKAGLARPEALYKESRRKALNAAIADINAYIKTVATGAAPIPKQVADTLRMYAADDDALFSGRDALKIAGASVDRNEVVGLLQQRAQMIVFNDFTGTEFQVFFAIYRRWISEGRPDSISVERTAFVRSLGYQSTGRTFLNAANRLRDQLKQWRTPTAYRIAVSDQETGGVDMTAEVYLPSLREHSASRRTKNRTVWEFGDLDQLLFPRQAKGGKFHRIAERPFVQITRKLGNTLAADRAKTAVKTVLTELTFGRTRPFEMQLKTLGMHGSDFSWHTDKRDESLQAVVDALSAEGIAMETAGQRVRIQPPRNRLE